MYGQKSWIIARNIRKIRAASCGCYCDFMPSTTVRLIRKNGEESIPNLKVEKPDFPQKNKNDISPEFRVNDVNIQMISKNLYEQLFKESSPNLDPNVVKRCQQDLKRHGIDYESSDHLPDVELKLPKLEGKNVVEHFYNIGERQAAPYRELLIKLAGCQLPPMPKKWSKQAGWHKYTATSPPQPVPCPDDDALILDVEVLMSAGKRPTLACAVSPNAWYGWVSEPLANNEPQTLYKDLTYDSLIPLETDGSELVGDVARPRVVVGHNVAYDRSVVKEQYWLEKTGVRFMDTMSMHTCVSGVTSYQRAMLKSKEKGNASEEDWMDISSLNSLTEVHKLYCGTAIDKATRDTFVDGTMEDVHANFQGLMNYCAGDVEATARVLKCLLPMFLERFPHPVTLAGMLELGSTYLPINSNWNQYIDSAETVFEDCKLETRQLLSLKADEACRLMINEEYRNDLWMWDEDWSTQILKLKKGSKKDSCSVVDMDFLFEKDTSVEKDYDVLCEDYIKQVGRIKDHDLPNTPKLSALAQKFGYLYSLSSLLPVRRPQLPGYPAWYRKLCAKRPSGKEGSEAEWAPGANNITTSMQITPKLLRLTWEGYPLHHSPTEKWGFLVPFAHNRPVSYEEGPEPQIPLKELLEKCPVVKCEGEGGEYSERTMERLSRSVEEDMGRRTYYARKKLDEKASENKYHGLGVWCGVQMQGCCHFLRLPHKDGPKYKVGNPLAKDFLDMFSQNVLAAQGNEAEKVLNFGRQMSYWRNNRERIMGQKAVWLPDNLSPLRPGDIRRYGAILPQVVVAGTLTRRASEPTWMTASNAHKERIGSELRAMVQAPPGYKFVGADVDSQELWIASLLGDADTGLAGGTAFGWSVLAGAKKHGTDLHSLTAKAAGVTRDHAKVINYARIYGAGQNFAERLLKQFNPTMTLSEAKSKAAKMFTTTKGRRVYRLKKEYMEGFMDEDLDGQVVEMTSYQAMRLAKMSGKKIDEMFERGIWVGGSESLMFNKLEEIADSEAAATAFLSGRLSRALEGGAAAGAWAGTRHNWCVQSAAADFLHLLLVGMTWLAPRARFCLSFHDEVRYLVPEELKYEAALGLQITNLLTRAFCSQRVGLHDLPLSVAFFTSVEVDQVLRKESNLCCTTPSNPHGLEKGYGIPSGESLDVFDVMEKLKIKES